MYLILLVVLAVYVTYKLITTVLPHHLLIPSQNWREKYHTLLNIQNQFI